MTKRVGRDVRGWESLLEGWEGLGGPPKKDWKSWQAPLEGQDASVGLPEG